MLTILSLVFSNWRAFLVGGAALALAGWAVYEREHLIAEGAQQEIQTMEKANAADLAKANQAATNVDLCYRTVGRVWDRATGMCVSAPASKPAVRSNKRQP